jgi:hypothetical protein
MSFCWLAQLRRIVWKELTSFSPFCRRQNIRFPETKLRFARILSNTLGFTCHKDNADWALRGNRSSATFRSPKTCQQMTKFLESTGFCQIWVPNYSLFAKPLFEATKRVEQEPMLWGEEQEKAFKEIKGALTNAPALPCQM